MYTRHFGLKEKPFANAPDQRFLYLSKSHEQACKHLRDGLNRNGGVILLTGKEGVGKTLLCRRFISEISSDINVALILNSDLNAMDFLAAICDELGIDYNAKSRTYEEYLAALNSYLLQALPTGKKTAIIIDDAHKLSSEVFIQLQKLTNSKNTPQKLLHVFLIGSPELRGTLKKPELASLLDDVTAEYRLPPLDKEEVSQYIFHRLKIAGGDPEIFSSDALRMVAAKSKGIPRRINAICDRAFEMAHSRGFDKLTPTVVEQAASELDGISTVRRKKRRRRPGGCPLNLLLLLLLGILAMLTYLNFPYLQGRLGRLTGLSSQQGEVASRDDREINIKREQDSGAPVAGKSTVPAGSKKEEPAWLQVDDSEKNRRQALHDLFAEWHIDYPLQSTQKPQEVAREHRLAYVTKQANWPGVLYFNRPVILEIKKADASTIHAVLVGLLDGNVIVKVNGNEYLLPENEVRKVWTHRFIMVKEER